MPGEHAPNSHEKGEVNNGLEAARAEKLAELKEAASEHDPADHAERRAEAAREVINKVDAPEDTPAPAAEAAPAMSPVHRLLNRHLNYAQTLESVQRRLNPASRTFSRVIHTPAVEKASEALEQTVARPSIMIGATWTALIVGTIFYLTARHYGYPLSGSEMIFSFVVGAVIGLLIEGIWHTLKRPKVH